MVVKWVFVQVLQSICLYSVSRFYYVSASILKTKFGADTRNLFLTDLAIRVLTSGSVIHLDVRALLQIIESQFAEILQNYGRGMRFTLRSSVKHEIHSSTDSLIPGDDCSVRNNMCFLWSGFNVNSIFVLPRHVCRLPVKILHSSSSSSSLTPMALPLFFFFFFLLNPWVDFRQDSSLSAKQTAIRWLGVFDLESIF